MGIEPLEGFEDCGHAQFVLHGPMDVQKTRKQDQQEPEGHVKLVQILWKKLTPPETKVTPWTALGM